MRSISLFLKHQFIYLFVLILVFVLPLGLFLQFSPYQLPKVQYVFIATLFVSQYVFYREKDYRKKKEEGVKITLEKELQKLPSNKEIDARLDQLIYYRSVSIGIAAFGILILMLIYQQF